MYEEKCMFLLRTALFVERKGNVLHGSAAEELARRIKRSRLNDAIEKFAAIAGLDPATQKAVLHDARDARNWIAHQSAAIGPLSSARGEEIAARRKELRANVASLARGDVLVSLWMDEMEAGRDYSPSNKCRLFPSWADGWVIRAALPVQGKRDPSTKRPTLREIVKNRRASP